MPSTIQHYDYHLGSVHEWMAGGADAAVASGDGTVERGPLVFLD